MSTLTAATVPCPTGPSHACGTVVTPTTTYEHVIWIVFENKAYSEIIGSPNALHINILASECGVATNFFAETQPSVPKPLFYAAYNRGAARPQPPASATPSMRSPLHF